MNEEFGMRKADCGRPRSRGACAPSFRKPHSAIRNRRRALTLVELMVSIAIVAILATLLLGAAAVAGETARDARSKSLVARLHTLLIERYDGYRNARVELRPYTDTPPYRPRLVAACGFLGLSATNPPPNDPRIEALTRLAATRELMKFEMPDRWSDVVGDVVPASPVAIPTVRPLNAADGLFPRYLAQTPPLYAVYARAYNRLVGQTNSVTKVINTADDIVANEGAELLYLVVINATADGEARSLFKQGDQGDTDGDGAPEFLDGWGRPISFVRWAPGFDSDAQLSAPRLNRLYDRQAGAPAAKREVVDRALREDHDPFDLFGLDRHDLSEYRGASDPTGLRGWRLAPLVASPGGDGELGLDLRAGAATRLDPYFRFSGPSWIGQVIDAEAAADNLHSHRVGALSRKR